MRVAFLSYNWGEYCIRLASALVQEAKICLMLAEQQAAPHLPLLDQKVNFQPFQKYRLRQPLGQLATLRQLLAAIKNFNPDVVHIQQGHFWFNFALPWLKRYPMVFTIHDPRHHLGDKSSQKTPQKIYDFGFRHAGQIIVHAKPMAQQLVEELHIPRRRVHIIPHIMLGDEREREEVPEEEHLILFFGRIWGYKGLEHLIRAEPLITAEVPDAKIMIAGRGENFDRYSRLMANPARFIIHNEYVSNEKRAELFRRACLLVLPYVEATQSGVVPLAYTFGKPVVATNVGGLGEQVEHGKTGWLVAPGNVEMLAEATVRLLKDKELRRRLGANGKRKVQTDWSPQAVAQQTLRVYEQAISGRARTG